MGDVIAKFFASLTFQQVVILIVVVFAMLMALIIVLARFAKISGIEKISTKGIEFDTDDAPAPKKRPARRRVARK